MDIVGSIERVVLQKLEAVYLNIVSISFLFHAVRIAFSFVRIVTSWSSIYLSILPDLSSNPCRSYYRTLQEKSIRGL